MILTTIGIPGEFFHDITDHDPLFFHKYFDLFCNKFHIFPFIFTFCD